jgi:hypothetical protein
MSKLLLTLLWFIPFSIVAQTKVAVYVVESSVDEGIKKIIGSEMVSAIVANKEYQAVERTPVFLEQLSKEQNVDEDQQISQIGKQIGVDNVCVVDITSFQSSYYIQARLLEVNEAVVLATAREISSLSNIDDIVSTTERIASKLIGEDAVVNQVGVEYSTIGSMSHRTKNFHIISVDNSGTFVKLTFKYCTPQQTTIYIKSETHLYSENDNKYYRLVDTEGITIEPEETNIPKGIYTFSLYFEKLPDDVTDIDFIEPDGWCIYDISLKPFGKRNYHEFIDNSESNYESVCLQYSNYLQKQEQQRKQQQEEQRRTKEAGENLARAIENVLTYNLYIMNTKLFPRMIWIGDRYIGIVKGKSEATFKVATTFYGSAKSVQSEGYVMYPTTETFYIQKPYGGQTVTWIIR